MDSLPNELLTRILGCISDREDRKSIQFVCRRWWLCAPSPNKFVLNLYHKYPACKERLDYIIKKSVEGLVMVRDINNYLNRYFVLTDRIFIFEINVQGYTSQVICILSPQANEIFSVHIESNELIIRKRVYVDRHPLTDFTDLHKYKMIEEPVYYPAQHTQGLYDTN
jgi:hypothetical protein